MYLAQEHNAVTPVRPLSLESSHRSLKFGPYRRMAENGFAPPLGNFADISYLVEN